MIAYSIGFLLFIYFLIGYTPIAFADATCQGKAQHQILLSSSPPVHNDDNPPCGSITCRDLCVSLPSNAIITNVSTAVFEQPKNRWYYTEKTCNARYVVGWCGFEGPYLISYDRDTINVCRTVKNWKHNQSRTFSMEVEYSIDNYQCRSQGHFPHDIARWNGRPRNEKCIEDPPLPPIPPINDRPPKVFFNGTEVKPSSPMSQ